MTNVDYQFDQREIPQGLVKYHGGPETEPKDSDRINEALFLCIHNFMTLVKGKSGWGLAVGSRSLPVLEAVFQLAPSYIPLFSASCCQEVKASLQPTPAILFCPGTRSQATID